MEELLKSKIIISLTGFGFVLSLILGIISRLNIQSMLIRIIISTLMMMSFSLLVHFFLKKNLNYNDFEIFIFGNKNENKTVNSSSKIDIVDDSKIDAEEVLLKNNIEENKDNDEPIVENTNIPEYNNEYNTNSENTSENDNTSENNIQNFKFSSESFLNKVNESANKKPEVKSRGDDIEIKVKNRTLKVDTKTVAKAIKTVLNRE